MNPLLPKTPSKNNEKLGIKTLLRLRVFFNVFFKSFFNYLAKLTLTTVFLNNKNLKLRPKILINVNSGFNLFSFTHTLHRKSIKTLKLKNTSPFNRQIYKLEHPNSITVRR